MRGRLLGLLTTTSLVLALPVTAAGAAQPAPPAEMPYPVASCSILMPAKLAVSRPATTYHIWLGDDCDPATFGWARWSVRNPRTGHDIADLYSDDMDLPIVLTWRDDVEGFGAFHLLAGAAFDHEMNPLTQNEPTFVAKARARSALTITRNRVSVTATISASYYNARLNRTIPWAGVKVQLQQSTAERNGRWTTAATVTTGADGVARISMWAHAPRWWRVVTPTTRSVFPSSTAPVFR